MPRKLRIEKNGFYHIINCGVARVNIYLCYDDFMKFLEIMQDASDEYHFEIYSYCLMNNHYHLLVKIIEQANLSQIMQKINSRYSIYFNNKYKRVGPLWQGRFKSWFVYDEVYLKTLVKYIEFNPIKANITNKIGQYRWRMSSKVNFEFSILNCELLERVDFAKELEKKELEKLDRFMSAKVDIGDDELQLINRLPLEENFKNTTREVAIAKAISDGWTQREIAEFLNLSDVAISKIYKIYRQKVKLFNKLRDKGIFWSYSKDISFEQVSESLP